MACRQVLVFALLATAIAAQQLPSIQTLPSTLTPLIFHHQRKAGGSTLRNFIVAAARENKVPDQEILVPCETAGCETWNWHHHNRKLAVIGGHFSVAEVWYQRWKLEEGDDAAFVKREDATCLTNFREPVSRVVSCLFFRFGSFQEEVSAGNMTAARLEEYLYKMSSYGYGCNNEAIRIMSGYGVEEVHNGLSSRDPDEVEWLIRETIKETKRCVVQVLHPPKSLLDAAKAAAPATAPDNLNEAILFHFFPWMRAGNEHLGHLFGNEHVPLTDPELLSVIEQHNWPESIVYHEALHLFAEQLAAALGVPPDDLISALPPRPAAQQLISKQVR